MAFSSWGGRVDQALVGEQALEGVQPALVIARGLSLALRVGDLGDQLRLELAPLEAGVVAHRDGHAEDAALPRLVEHELAVLPRQRRRASHVGNLATRYGIHDASLPGGRRGWPHDCHADHRVPRDHLGQLSLAHSLGAGGPLGQYQIPELGARVPDADLHALGKIDAELAQHDAGLAHRPRAVLERLVPDRRQADERVRVARAERADDHVVDAGPVLDDLQVDAAEAQLLDGLRPVGQEPLLVRRVDPRPRDDLGAVVRADVLLVRAHDAVDGLARDELLLHQQGLERAHAQREDRFGLPVMMAMLVAVLVMGVAHDGLLPGAATAGSRYRS